jgi:hypothetical protein
MLNNVTKYGMVKCLASIKSSTTILSDDAALFLLHEEISFKNSSTVIFVSKTTTNV